MPTLRTRTWMLVAIAAIGAIALAPLASADLKHFISITGATQNTFPGGSTTAPYEGFIVGFEYHHLLERPSAASPTQHQTVISTIAMDEPAIPHLLRALDTDEALGISFSFLRPTLIGAEEVYATVILLGAKVVSIEPLSTDDQDPSLSSYKATVRVRFSYTSMTFEHVPATDSVVLTNSGS